MGFNEIQFDYVRFPDNTDQYEASGDIDFRNEYGETKAQAIQRFLMYATDILHEYGVYVGADVFGETSRSLVVTLDRFSNGRSLASFVTMTEGTWILSKSPTK